jgi:hypothetical protein
MNMKSLKNAMFLFAVVLISVAMVSCGGRDSSKKAEDRLGKLEVVIPDELKDNPEIITYIEGMSEVVDSYALLMDEMIGDLSGFEGKEWEDLKIGEQLKLTRLAATFAMKAAPITAKWAEYEVKKGNVTDELTEEEMMALETVYRRFEKRMEQIEEKNREFFGGVNS